MTGPTNDLPMEQWAWNDLLNYCAWKVISGLLKGDPLRETMHQVCHIATTWERMRVEAETKTKKRPARKHKA